jgi:hypothetical protein
MKGFLLILLLAITLAIKGKMHKMQTTAIKHSTAAHTMVQCKNTRSNCSGWHHWCIWKHH